MAIPVYNPPPPSYASFGSPPSEKDDPPPPPGITRYPSNADLVYLGKLTSDGDAEDIGKWWGRQQLLAGVYTTQAPRGHYILDPFELDRATASGIAISSQQIDERPASVGFFAGRVWWAGVDNDKYVGTVFFSQLLESDQNIGKCYQEADPVAEDISDLVDTDGGVIPIPEAGHIMKLIPFNESIIAFADNGIWAIGGEGGFVATSYSVRKISSVGVLSAESVVEAENFIFFWSDSGIYRLQPDNITGYLSPANLTTATIQTFYNELPAIAKFRVFGMYDNTEKRVWWYYNPNPTWDGAYGGEGSLPGSYSNRYTNALVFDLTLEAFYPHEFADGESTAAYVAGAAMSGTNTRQAGTEDICVNGVLVEVLLDQVVIPTVETSAAQQTQQILIVDISGSWLDFGTYSGVTFEDFDIWSPEAYTSYMETGYDISGTILNEKQTVWVAPAFKRTEKSYTVASSAGTWDNESACRLRAKWDWTSHNNSSKWSQNEDAYRLLEPFSFGNVDGSYTYNGGQEVVKTRLRVRGSGHALQLRFESETGKDLHLYGWEMIMEGTNVP